MANHPPVGIERKCAFARLANRYGGRQDTQGSATTGVQFRTCIVIQMHYEVKQRNFLSALFEQQCLIRDILDDDMLEREYRLGLVPNLGNETKLFQN